MRTVSRAITGQRKRTKPQSEWTDPSVAEYESDIDSGALQRKHNIDGAVAASTGQAGLDEGRTHKDALK